MKSTEALPTLKLTDGTYATTDNKAENSNNFFSSGFTNETTGD